MIPPFFKSWPWLSVTAFPTLFLIADPEHQLLMSEWSAFSSVGDRDPASRRISCLSSSSSSVVTSLLALISCIPRAVHREDIVRQSWYMAGISYFYHSVILKRPWFHIVLFSLYVPWDCPHKSIHATSHPHDHASQPPELQDLYEPGCWSRETLHFLSYCTACFALS